MHVQADAEERSIEAFREFDERVTARARKPGEQPEDSATATVVPRVLAAVQSHDGGISLPVLVEEVDSPQPTVESALLRLLRDKLVVMRTETGRDPAFEEASASAR